MQQAKKSCVNPHTYNIPLNHFINSEEVLTPFHCSLLTHFLQYRYGWQQQVGARNSFAYQIAKMKQLIYCLALLCPMATPAQNNALSIGNSLPPLQVQLLNNSNTAYLFSHYKGKAIIIDFFATWCSNCIYAVPELNRIQQSFNGQLQVVLVSGQSAAVLQNFLPKNRYTKANKLPVIAADTVLAKLFPHVAIPHQVWIGPDGIVKAITSGKQLTTQNVEALVKGQPLNLPVKQDRLNHNPSAPLFFTAGTVTGVKAAFGEPLTGLQRMSVMQSDSLGLRFTMVNQTIIGLYRLALHKNTGKKIILQVSDSSRFLPLTADPERWKTSNTHCFEIVAPAAYKPAQLRQHMVQQLNSYFNCTGTLAVQNLPCLFLQTTARGITPAVNAAPQTVTGSELVWSLTNQPLAQLCEWFNRATPYNPLEGLPYVVNQTGYAGNIDIALTAKHIRQGNLKAINKELAAFGLQLVPGSIETEVLLITDQHKPKNQ